MYLDAYDYMMIMMYSVIIAASLDILANFER